MEARVRFPVWSPNFTKGNKINASASFDSSKIRPALKPSIYLIKSAHLPAGGGLVNFDFGPSEGVGLGVINGDEIINRLA